MNEQTEKKLQHIYIAHVSSFLLILHLFLSLLQTTKFFYKSYKIQQVIS